MFPYAMSGIVAGYPNDAERSINQINEYLSRAIGFIGHAASEHPNEFVIALAGVATAAFTLVLALRTAGLFKETSGLREETAALAKFAKQQADDMKASIAAAQEANRISRDSLAVEHRAWITVEMSLDSLSIQGNGMVSGDVVVTVKNIGKTPASGLYFGAHMWTGIQWEKDGLLRTKKSYTLADEIDADLNTYLRPDGQFRQFVVFPGEEVRQRWGVVAPHNKHTPLVSIFSTVIYSCAGIEGQRITVAVYEAIWPSEDRTDVLSTDKDGKTTRTIAGQRIGFLKASGGRAT